MPGPIENVIERPDLSSITDAYFIRDMEPFLSVVLTKNPITREIIRETGDFATQHVHEWTDDVLQQKTSTLTANIAAHAASATGLTITVADSSIFLVDDQVFVDTIEPAYKVTAIPNGTTLTVNEIRGRELVSDGGNGKTIKYNRGQLENTSYGTPHGARFGLQKFNYTQIFRYDLEASWHEQESARLKGLYNVNDLIANATEQGLHELGFQLYDAVTKGIAVKRESKTTKGMMNGVREYVDVSGGNVLTASGALSVDMLNDALKMIYDDVNDLSNIIILAPTALGQEFETLNATNLRYVNPQPSRAVGENVTSFIPSIPHARGVPIFLDPNMPSNELWLLDRSRIYLMPFGRFRLGLYEGLIPGKTATTKFLYAEYTLVVRNGAQAHGIIKGITV